jgi:hypothetical protein
LLLTILLPSACSNIKDALSMRPSVAAEAAGQTLSVDRLTTMMVGVKGVPQTLEAAEFLANTWIDEMLLMQAMVAGTNLADSAAAARVLWPELTEQVGAEWHDSLLARRVSLGKHQSDSAYAAGQLRVLQHILFKFPDKADPKQKAVARKKAEQALAQIRHGANFSVLAVQLTEDMGSKGDSGYLAPGPRGRFLPAFDSAGWKLAPGAVTGPVETSFGFHLIRRPPPEEVERRILDLLRSRAGAHLDSLYLDSLGIRRNVQVVRGAPQMVRSAIADPTKARKSKEVLATYTGGQFTVSELMQWVAALGAGFQSTVMQASDSALGKFVRTITQNTLLVQEADSAGIRVPPDVWAHFLERYRGGLDTLRSSFGLARPEFNDSSVPLPERTRAGAIAVNAKWDEIIAGRTKPKPIPPLLAILLREQGQYRIFPPGVQQALQAARTLREQAEHDTTRRTPAVPKPSSGSSPAPNPGPPPSPKP